MHTKGMVDLYNIVLYANPYMVVTPRGYTKHYYNGSQRIAARLGDYWAASVADESDMIARAREVLEQTMNNSDIEEEHFEEKYVRSIDGEEFYLEPFTLYTHYMTCTYPEDILHEVLNGGERFADYIGGIDRGIFYYHPDHLGSSSWITDDRGQVVQYLHYMPFGELWENQQAFEYDERFKFTGKERDTETGYDYFGARYYASTLPMWLSVDPLANEYPSINPYAYCAWNPIKYIDPNGKVLDIAWDIANVALDIYSLQSNISQGNVADAVIDGVGLLLDVAAAALPFVPGGVGTALKVYRTADKVKDAAGTGKSIITATKSTYRKALQQATGKIGKGYEAHHTLPQKHRGEFEKLPVGGINLEHI